MAFSPDLTIVTASIPERSDLLQDAIASVEAQTIQTLHLVEIDHHHLGPPATINSLMMQVTTPWAMVLDDDDLLYPEHVETVLKSIDGDAEVIYAVCDFENGEWLPYLEEYDFDRLMVQSIVPMTAMFRTDLWKTYGGLHNRKDYDWDFWKRLARGGTQFMGLDDVTWQYRFSMRPGHVNDSRGNIRESFLKPVH